ncbi:hypothetical protein Taro_043358 [Colocasia esculenta]|uniref:Uncharacterized protein n=1 Tax=Colocasia esculenta TaxID=4460 RepID=A0A843X1C3_COLES|nr:hypothetical protein [Colocasia esculenta]
MLKDQPDPYLALPVVAGMVVVAVVPLYHNCEEEGRAWCRGIVDLAWSEEEVANRRERPHWGSFFMKGRDCLNPSRSSSWAALGSRILSVCLSVDVAMARRIATSEEASGFRRDTLLRRNRVAVAVPFPVMMASRRLWGSRQHQCFLGCFRWPGCVSACAPGQALPLGPSGREHGSQQFVAVPVVLAPPFARCLALEGLSRSEVVSVAWDPHPREPVEGVLRATSVLELAADWADSGAERKMREVRRKVAAWPGCGVACVGVLLRRLFSVGIVGLALCGPILLVVSASVFSRFRGPVLGCQSMVALTCVVSQPCGMSTVRGGSACGPSTLWRFKEVVLVVRRRSHLVVAWSQQVRGFPASFVCTLQCVAVVAALLTWRVWSLGVYVLWLREPACGVAFTGVGLLPVEPCRLVMSSGEVLPESFSVGSGGKLFAVVLNDALVVLVECAVWFGCILARFSQDGSLRFGVEGWGRHDLLCPFRLTHRMLVLECFGFVPSGALVHCVVPWVAPGACDSTTCCVVWPYRWYAGLRLWPLSEFSLSSWGRVCSVVVPYFGLGSSEVGVFTSTSAVVLVSVWLCVALAWRCVSVASWVSDATVIRVTMSVCVASLSGSVSPLRLRIAPCQWVVTAFRHVGRLTPVRVVGKEESCAWCRGVVDLAWSEEEVANQREGPYWGSFSVKGRDCLYPSRSGWIGSPSSSWTAPGSRIPLVYLSADVVTLSALRHQKRRRPGRARPYRDSGGCGGALPRHDGIATALGVATVPVLSRVLPLAQLCVGVCLRAGFALRTFCQQFGAVPVVLAPPFARCLALEGMSRLEVGVVAWAKQCWLVVSSGEVLPESFSVGSGGKLFAVVLNDALVVLVEDLPLSLLVEVLPRSALCLFWATVVLPLWFEVCRLVGLHFGMFSQDDSLCFGVEVLPRVTSCVVLLAVRLAAALARLPCYSFPSFSFALVGLHVSPWLRWFASFLAPCVLSQMVVWVAMLHCGVVLPGWPYRCYAGLRSWPVSEFSLSLWERVCSVMVPYFGLGPSEVGVLTLTSAVVLVSMCLCVALIVFTAFPMLSSPVWNVCSSWVAQGSRISLVCLSANVATARRVTTSEEASAWSSATRLAVAIRVTIATCFPVATWLLSRRVALSQQGGCRGALPHHDGVTTALGVTTVPMLPRVLSLARLCVGVCPRAGFALRTFCQQFGAVLVVLAPPFARTWHLRACPVQRLSPLPGTPILGSLLRECFGLRACSTLSRPSAGAEVGAWLASRACGLRVPLLAASGGGLVAVVVTTLPHDVSKFCGGTDVCGFLALWHVHSPEWFCLWALDLVEV